jgi:hypothetical protein
MAEAQAVKEKTPFVFPDEKEERKDEAKPEEELEISVAGEEDVKIEVVDDTPEADRGKPIGASKDIQEVSEEELAAYSGNVQKRIKALDFARHDERRAKEAAIRERTELERVAQGALDENKRLKEYVQAGEKTYQGTAKAAATAKLENAKAKYKAAHEAFDGDGLVAAQQELTSAQLELVAAENFKPISLTPQAERDYTPATEQVRPDERAVGWQQRNQWFGANKRMTAFALGLHQELVESGVDPRTDDYYKRLDAELHQTFPKAFLPQREEAPSSPAHRKPANVVAPTARSSSAKKVRLTQTQVNLAKKFGLTLEEYAQQVVQLENNNDR